MLQIYKSCLSFTETTWSLYLKLDEAQCEPLWSTQEFLKKAIKIKRKKKKK